MTVDFYIGFSKKPNSTKIPATTGPDAVSFNSKTVTLKKPTSVLNPVFILNGYNLSYNYVKWGSRYYFVDDIVIVSNEVAEYHCSTDVLATYKTVIGSSTQYVTRAASAAISTINDAIYPTYAGCTVTNTTVDKLTCVEDGSVLLNGGGCYIIGIQNKRGTSHGGISYYAMSGTAMYNLLRFMFSDASFLDASDISLELQKELVNPFQYISSIMWYPIDPTGSSTITGTENLSFGYWDGPTEGANPVYGYPLNYRCITFSKSVILPKHPQALTRGAYLNGAPYTRHKLIFNSFGEIPIDATYFTSNTDSDRMMAIKCDLDLITGTGILQLTDPNGNVIYKNSGQVGVNSQISQITQNMLGAGVSILSGAVGLAYGNVVGFGQGILSGLQNIMPERQTTGHLGSIAAWECQANPRVVSTYFSQTPADVTQLGRPLCAPTQINTLSGFVQVDRADIDITGTEKEKEKIISYMQGGFYYE